MIDDFNSTNSDSEATRVFRALQQITSDGDNALVKSDRYGKLRIRKVVKTEVKY